MRKIVLSMLMAVGLTFTACPIASMADTQTEFVTQYQNTLDEMLATCRDYTPSDVIAKMKQTPYDRELRVNLPYEGFIYPVVNDGTAMKIYSDRLYYGDIVNGVAEGQGTLYKHNIRGYWNDGYYVGQWSNDAPNGQGEEWANCATNSGSSSVIHTVGSYVNWYQDGDMVVEYHQNGRYRTYKYHVTDKLADVIETKITSKGKTPAIAIAEDYPASFLTYYNTAQTVLHQDIDDGNLKNSHGFWNVGL